MIKGYLKKHKRAKIRINLIVMVFALVFVFYGQTMAKNLVLKYGTESKPGNPTLEAEKMWANLVKERTNGRVEIKIFPSGQLGYGHALIENTLFGGNKSIIL